jgi:iron complex outermembrane receptor protein
VYIILMNKTLLLLFLLPSLAVAQKTDTLSTVTVTAVRGTETTPITQTTLTKPTIDNRNYGQDMTFLLTTTPSITATSDNGATNSYTYMRLRGLDQTRINMTLDGVPLNEPEDQGVYFSNYPDFASSVQSAQVQRGVGTSSNGTAAYAGSVNFESIDPLDSHRGIEWSYNQNRAADWTQTIGSTGIFFRHTIQNVPGYRDHSENRSNSTYLSSLSMVGRNLIRVTAFDGLSNNQLAYLATQKSTLDTNPTYNPLGKDEDDHFRQGFASVALTHLFSNGATFSVTPYYIHLRGSYRVRIDGLWNFSVASNWAGALANWTYKRDGLQTDIGLHANTYTRDHFMNIGSDRTEQYRNAGTKNEQSGFIKFDRSLSPRVNLVTDIQVRSTDFRYHPSGNSGVTSDYIRWTFLNPKIGVTFWQTPALRWYTSVGKNTREPTRSDMFAGFDNLDTSNVAFVGDFNRVKPERVRDVEAGVTYNRGWYAIGANLFNMDFHNEIAPIGQLSYIGLPLRKNVDASYRRGLEVDGRAHVRRLTLSSNLSVMQAKIRAYTDAAGVTYRNVTPLLTPPVLSNTTVGVQLAHGLSVALDGRYVAASHLDNTNSNFVNPASFITAFHGSYTVRHLTTSLWVNNLNNQRAYSSGYTDGTEPYYFIIQPRNLSLGLRYDF